MRIFLLGLLSVTTRAFAGICAALFLAGFVPSDHHILDTVSFFRPIFLVGAGLGLVVARGWWRFGVLGLCLCGAVSIWLSLPAARPGEDLRLYSKNIRYDTSDTVAMRDDILASGVDVVMLQELSPTNITLLARLSEEFPYQAVCEQDTVFALAVLSKSPFLQEPRCSFTRGMAAAQVALDGQAVWLVSVHWPWPWPAGGKWSDRHLRSLLVGLDGPVVLAGDFNTMPWAHRLTEAMRLTDTWRAGGTPLTLWHAKLRVPLPLDYVLAPGGGTVEARPLLGSDHMGLLADISVFDTPRD